MNLKHVAGVGALAEACRLVSCLRELVAAQSAFSDARGDAPEVRYFLVTPVMIDAIRIVQRAYPDQCVELFTLVNEHVDDGAALVPLPRLLDALDQVLVPTSSENDPSVRR